MEKLLKPYTEQQRANFIVTYNHNMGLRIEETEEGLFAYEKTQEELEEIALRQELAQLLTWFEEYDNQVKQYERCQRLGIEFDKDIVELDNQAKANAERIAEIRKSIKEN